jgi:hypothetical protein
MNCVCAPLFLWLCSGCGIASVCAPLHLNCHELRLVRPYSCGCAVDVELRLYALFQVWNCVCTLSSSEFDKLSLSLVIPDTIVFGSLTTNVRPSPPRLLDGYVLFVVACVRLATDGQMVLLHC